MSYTILVVNVMAVFMLDMLVIISDESGTQHCHLNVNIIQYVNGWADKYF